MLMGLAQAVAIQGPIVLLGIVATPAATVLFSTSRTLARIGTSIANVVNFSFAPEYSRLHGRGDQAGFSKLERLHGRIGIAGIFIYGLGLWMAGPWLMHEWTHGKVSALQPFFGLMNAAVIAEMIWVYLFTPISSINRHVRLSYLFVALTIGCAIPAWHGAVVAGPTGIALVLVSLHVVMCAILLIALQSRQRTVQARSAQFAKRVDVA
jgi:O-antigen/teichoic acid export membrane protein